ncbi:MAG TPA: hypothetical protein VIG71_06905 [Enteractinococcus sp.]
MKVLPVLTASAVGGVMAAVSISSAYATAAEPIFQVHSTVSLESASFPEPEESGNFEDVAVEEGTSDETDIVESDTPAPEIEVQPQATKAEVPTEPEVAISETAGAQAAETPVIGAVEILSALPTEESLAEVAQAPPEKSMPQATAPLNQQPATQSTLPSIEEALLEAGSSSTNGAGLGGEAPLVEAGAAQAADEGDPDTPREPRPVETLDPAEIHDEDPPSENATENSPAAAEETPSGSEAKKDTASEQTIDREVEAVESPSEDSLSQTGSPAAALAIGATLLLVAGITLAAWRRRHHS